MEIKGGVNLYLLQYQLEGVTTPLIFIQNEIDMYLLPSKSVCLPDLTISHLGGHHIKDPASN